MYKGAPPWSVANIMCSATNISHRMAEGSQQKKKSKYQDIVLISAYSYPPTTNKDTLIRDDFDFIFPPTLLKKIGTFLEKNWFPSTFQMIFTF